jgi:hypothetical protein
MSDSNPPAPPDPPLIPPQAPSPQRSGCLTAFMVIVGLILLLPGLCALIFGVGSLSSSHYDPGFTPFIVFGALLGIAGGVLIRFAIRGPRP